MGGGEVPGEFPRVSSSRFRLSKSPKGVAMKERITEIEIQLMHHENTIQQLNEVITRQQVAIEELQTDFRQIMQHLRNIYPSDVIDPQEEEPPPHY